MMWLALHWPDAWERKHTVDGDQLAVLAGASGPRAIATWSPLTLRNAPSARDGELLAESDLVAGSVVTRGPSEALQTTTGWPLVVLDATVERLGVANEYRTCAVFAFLEHAGAVLIRFPSRGEQIALSPEIRAILATATPVWNQRASLAEQCDPGALAMQRGGLEPRSRSRLQQ